MPQGRQRLHPCSHQCLPGGSACIPLGLRPGYHEADRQGFVIARFLKPHLPPRRQRPSPIRGSLSCTSKAMCPERPSSAASHRRRSADDQVWQSICHEYVVDPAGDLGLSPELVGFLWSRPHRGRAVRYSSARPDRAFDRDVCPLDSAAGGDVSPPPPLRLLGLHLIAGSLGRLLSLLRRRALGCDMADRGGLTPRAADLDRLGTPAGMAGSAGTRRCGPP
jgi:hypothetical protein